MILLRLLQEKNRLGAELAQTNSRLMDAQRNIVRLTRELESASELSTKVYYILCKQITNLTGLTKGYKNK